MALSLDKGKKLSLEKENKSGALNIIRVDMTWNAPETTGNKFQNFNYDLDAMAFIIDENGKAVDNYAHFCFHQQQETPAIKSSGDDLNGDDGGESLLITLGNVPARGAQIPVIVDLYKAKERNQNLTQMKDGVLRISNHETNQVLAEIQMKDAFESTDTSLLFAMINRTSTGWEVENVSVGYPKSIADWVALYGIDLNA